jgi:hypothetical protein
MKPNREPAAARQRGEAGFRRTNAVRSPWRLVRSEQSCLTRPGRSAGRAPIIPHSSAANAPCGAGAPMHRTDRRCRRRGDRCVPEDSDIAHRRERSGDGCRLAAAIRSCSRLDGIGRP